MGITGSRSVLVTGGAGFIGSHLLAELVRNGERVVVVDDFSNGTMENLKEVQGEVEIVRGDVSTPLEEFRELLGRNHFRVIFHLACHPRSLSLLHPSRDLEVNAKGTLNILELAREDHSKVVFTSNSGIYGEPQYLPIDEKHRDHPTTPYDANKLVAEYYLKIYHRTYGLPIAICRLATVYGERQRTKPGWKPVIAEFAANCLNGQTSTIHWDGEQTRDLIYVKDVVQGLLKAAAADTTEEVFILGTNRETSINQIYETVCQFSGRRLEPLRKEKMDGDIRRMVYSYDKAKESFGFEPEIGMDVGIRRYIDWARGEF